MSMKAMRAEAVYRLQGSAFNNLHTKKRCQLDLVISLTKENPLQNLYLTRQRHGRFWVSIRLKQQQCKDFYPTVTEKISNVA